MQWTAVSDPLAQPMSARLLAGFLRAHFHDNLSSVLDDYVRVDVSFANRGVQEEARAVVEQGGSITRSGWRVQWHPILPSALDAVHWYGKRWSRRPATPPPPRRHCLF